MGAVLRAGLAVLLLGVHVGVGSAATAAQDARPAGDGANVYESTLLQIARSIEALKAAYPQLTEFSAAAHLNREKLTITYGYRTEAAPRTGGWTSGVPSPTDEGVWFYIDVHDADSTAQIHTQPVVPRYRYGDKRVMLLLREGAGTKPLSAALVRVLLDHGVTAVEPASRDRTPN
jgi:hypothetical protein